MSIDIWNFFVKNFKEDWKESWLRLVEEDESILLISEDRSVDVKNLNKRIIKVVKAAKLESSSDDEREVELLHSSSV